jgi:hypothetical protein
VKARFLLIPNRALDLRRLQFCAELFFEIVVWFEILITEEETEEDFEAALVQAPALSPAHSPNRANGQGLVTVINNLQSISARVLPDR